MTSTCTFELNQVNGAYFCGEKIKAKIILTTQKNKNVEEVSVLLLGQGKVGFEDCAEPVNRFGSTTSKYGFHEVYSKTPQILRGRGVLLADRYTYIVEIPVPPDCPTSCEGKYGHIRYEILLQIKRPAKYSNIFKKPVTVLKKVDLNLTLAYRIPFVIEAVKATCCLPFMSGTIACSLTLPYGAYAPGQAVRYCLHIDNQSMKSINGYYIDLVREMTFTARTPGHKERQHRYNMYCRSFSIPCERNSRCTINKAFLMPSTPPTTDVPCIIRVQYILKISICLAGSDQKITLDGPLVVGTTPIRQSLIRENVICDERNIAGYDVPETNEAIKPLFFLEEHKHCTQFLDYGVDEVNRIKEFRPSYPMYALDRGTGQQL